MGFRFVLALLAACGGGGGGGGDGGDGSGEDPGAPPVADFQLDPDSGPAPLEVTFTDLSSGAIDTWSWNFGDGTGSGVQHPVHVYETPGIYDVTLTVTGASGSDTIFLPDGVTASAGDLDCQAEDATQNSPFPLKSETYDFIPVVPDGSQGFWEVYSVRDREDGSPGVGNNVGMFVFDLGGSQVLLFGAGYGDVQFPNGGPLFDAAHDAALFDEVVQGCIGYVPALTTVRFVAPHGHPDHVNGSLLRELRALQYAVADIVFHEDDFGAINGLSDWSAADRAIFDPVPGAGCNVAMRTWASPLGMLWMTERPGHTPGSVDIVLDVNDDVNDRVVVLGSEGSSTCGGSPLGTVLTITAHGNAIVN
jgi:PKD repeat protein